MNRKGDRDRRKRGVPPKRKRAYVCEVSRDGQTFHFGTFSTTDSKAVEYFKGLIKQVRGKILAVHALKGELKPLWARPPWKIARTVYQKA